MPAAPSGTVPAAAAAVVVDPPPLLPPAVTWRLVLEILALREKALVKELRSQPFFFCLLLSWAEQPELTEFNEHIESELWCRCISAPAGAADDAPPVDFCPPFVAPLPPPPPVVVVVFVCSAAIYNEQAKRVLVFVPNVSLDCI